MKVYQTKLKGRREIAKDTLLLVFAKPKGFEFRAGQFIHLELMDLPKKNHQGSSRAFSLASAPFEKEILIAIRMRRPLSPFKKHLRDLALGEEVKLHGPVGVFTLARETAKPIAFLVGGIGITPVRSMVLEASYKKSPQKMSLFYSNNTPEETAFLEELASVNNPHYTFIPTMTKLEESRQAWQGERGFITMKMIRKYLPPFRKALYYIVGPPGFVKAMEKMLGEAGIPDKQIKKEAFAGY